MGKNGWMALAAVVASSVSFPSVGDELDLSKLSCSAFVKKVADTPPDNPQAYFITILNTWLYGFAASKSGSSALSGTIAKQFAADLGDECAKNPDESVLVAAESVGDRTLKPRVR